MVSDTLACYMLPAHPLELCCPGHGASAFRNRKGAEVVAICLSDLFLYLKVVSTDCSRRPLFPVGGLLSAYPPVAPAPELFHVPSTSLGELKTAAQSP
jgi:hypothetical protein